MKFRAEIVAGTDLWTLHYTVPVDIFYSVFLMDMWHEAPSLGNTVKIVNKEIKPRWKIHCHLNYDIYKFWIKDWWLYYSCYYSTNYSVCLFLNVPIFSTRCTLYFKYHINDSALCRALYISSCLHLYSRNSKWNLWTTNKFYYPCRSRWLG